MIQKYLMPVPVFLALFLMARAGASGQTTGSLIVDLDAKNLTDPATWVNQGSLGNFSMLGAPTVETVQGVTAVTFHGNGDAYQGPATVATLEGSHARSIEVWALNPVIADEETMVAWGHRGGGPDGSNMSFNYGANASYGAVGHWGGNYDLGWGPKVPSAGLWHYLTYTYDGAVAKVYDNGVLASQRNVILATHAGNSLEIAAQNDGAGLPQAALSGVLSIARVRVRDSALTAVEIGQNFTQDAGALASINLRAETNMVIGGAQTAVISGNYATMPNVALNQLPANTFSSSDTNILTVNTNGLIKAVASGPATITASYQGKTAQVTIMVALPPPAKLVHRYDFNQAAGETTATDLVGTANGTLLGGASLSGDGLLVLDGSSGYVDLPNGMISSMTNATFETWVTWNGTRMWERIFDFGTSDAGEDMQGNGTTYLFLSPRGGANVPRSAITITGGGAGEQMVDAKGPFTVGRETHVAVVYNYSGRMAKLYIDGQLINTVAVNIPFSSLQDVNNWLGKAQWPDPYFTGNLNEFRIYEGALTDFEVAVSAAAGPNNPKTDAGAIQSVTLEMEPTINFNGFSQTKIFGNYAEVSHLNLNGMPGATYQSSNTNFVTVDATGLLHSVGVGTVTITATYQGKQDFKSITVIQPPAVLKHRYSFNEASGTTTVKDSQGSADGFIVGAGSFTGSGQLVLDGVDSFVDLPNGIISSMTNLTVEAWTTWNNNLNSWERIFDFGNSSGGEDVSDGGTTYMFMSPRGGSGTLRYGITITGGGAGEEILNGPAALTAGQETYVAIVYNYSARAAKLYVNGKMVDTRTVDLPLKSIVDVNNWLGRSQFRDAFYNGSYNEFRIYEGALTDFDIALDVAAGAEKLGTAPGQLTSLSIQSPTNTLLLGAAQNVNLFAQYENVPNVNVTTMGETAFQSSDPSILGVNAQGQVQAFATGSAYVIGQFKGLQTSNLFSVVNAEGVPAKAELVHRYSFSDQAGSLTAKDSKGGADGTLIGATAQFADGQLVLNGSYVLLPSGIISAHTNLTVEAWLTWSGGPDWQRIFDFGSTLGVPGTTGAGVTWFGVSPRRGDSQRLGFAAITPNQPEILLNAPSALATNKETQVVLSYNYAANATRIYIDGQSVAISSAGNPLSTLNDTNNCIGASEWTWDPVMGGQFNEFRIYNGAMLDADVAASFAAGPDKLAGEATAPSLKVTRSAGSIIITWPSSAAGYTLELRSSLSSGAWASAGLTPAQEGSEYKVTMATTGTEVYFRLKK